MIRAMALASALAIATAAVPANAATYNFTQGSWEDTSGNSVPGILSFVIVGADSDSDGYITYNVPSEPAEATGFSLNWSGNALVPAYSYSALSNLLVLNMPVSGDLTAATSIVISLGSMVITVGGGGTLGSGCDGTTLCGTIAGLTGTIVTKAPPLPTPSGAEDVPEPATLALLGLGIAGLAGARARRRG